MCMTKPVDDTAPFNMIAKPTPIRAGEPLKNVLDFIRASDDPVELAVRIPKCWVVLMLLR